MPAHHGNQWVKMNKEKLSWNGVFSVGSNYDMTGTLSINGENSVLHLWTNHSTKIGSLNRETLLEFWITRKRYLCSIVLLLETNGSAEKRGTLSTIDYSLIMLLLDSDIFCIQKKAISKYHLSSMMRCHCSMIELHLAP